MEAQIKAKVEDCFKSLLGYVPSYKIVYKSIGRGVAGTATYATNTLTFDPFFINQDPDKYLARTVPHEVAHLACKIMYPKAKQHHGPEWRSLMRQLGAEETKFHSYSTDGAPGRHERPYQYGCACDGQIFNLTKRMHTSIVAGKHRHCLKCKTTIVLKGIKG